ncbi:MAG: histidine phosphatase family protein [Rhizobiaceae bacterium]|nr:histidine phosphatase family protein [Rhizobiaceae bacterium]
MLRWVTLAMGLLMAGAAQATEAGWALLREGGHVVLLRHAIAPGTGDPANFDIDNCRTQRNLSERGRQQARKMGALFDTRAEYVERVLSSRYCRCLDTAGIAFRDVKAEPFAALDPPGDDADAAKADREAILGAIGDFSGQGNLVMVTHLETIQALTGQSPREGEALIVRRQGEALHVLGRIVFN